MNRILMLGISALICAGVLLHPGRTDSQGGHTDRSTGEYHFHHGFPAHQHEDRDGDGVAEYCPYDHVDKTGENSGSGGRIATYATIHMEPVTVATSQPSSPTPKNSGSSGKSSGGVNADTVAIALVPAFILLIATFVEKSKLDQYRDTLDRVQHTREQEAKERETLEQEKRELTSAAKAMCAELAAKEKTIDKAKSELAACKKEHADYVAELQALAANADDLPAEDKIRVMAMRVANQNKSIAKLANDLEKYHRREALPDGVFFTRNGGMPCYCSLKGRPWGEYTAYLNEKTGIYHSDIRCAGGLARSKHIFDVLEMKGVKPCQKCGMLFDREVPEWWGAWSSWITVGDQLAIDLDGKAQPPEKTEKKRVNCIIMR